MLDWIEEQTHSLCEADPTFTYSLKTKLFWALNEVHDWGNLLVRCTQCGTPLHKFNVLSISKGYRRKTCCKECERKQANEKTRRVMLEKYGVDNAFAIPEVRQKFKVTEDTRQCHRNATRKKHFGDAPGWNLEKSISTRRQKYGSAWNQAEVRNTKLRLHQDANWNNPEKNFATRKQNGTCNTSKPEEKAYRLLVAKFGADDVIRQFKSEQYPFACDFYVKSRDLYIECNFSWVHGGHFFDECSQDDLAIAEKWKAKKTRYYQNAIHTWTIRDKQKLETALANELNYAVWWNLDEARIGILKI